jgi:hypothetical protein
MPPKTLAELGLHPWGRVSYRIENGALRVQFFTWKGGKNSSPAHRDQETPSSLTAPWSRAQRSSVAAWTTLTLRLAYKKELGRFMDFARSVVATGYNLF